MPASGKKSAQSTPAEITLVHLKNCLVNLPSSLVSALVNANTPAQNVVVELIDRQSAPSSNGRQASDQPRSIYVGWTGMPSKRTAAPIVGRDGIMGARGSNARKEQIVASVEIDATFARMLGVTEGQKLGVILHLDPPLALTVNIEPLTPDDWEIIELHATFLELNLLSQIRALPNPSSTQQSHPLTLHLSPTSTANIVVTALTPALSPSTAFAKIAPDAEVIVAPKARSRPTRSNGRESSKSVASAGPRSVGGRSGASTARHRGQRGEIAGRGALFFRGVDRGVDSVVFEDADDLENTGLKVWVDEDVLSSNALRGTLRVAVSIIKPATLLGSTEPKQPVGQGQSGGPGSAVTPATRVIASIAAWEDAPDSKHVALSTTLCASLGSAGMVGGIVRIEAAPPQVAKASVKRIKVYPFISSTRKPHEGLKFGGESQTGREEVAQTIRRVYGHGAEGEDVVLDGPLTDGLVLDKGVSERESDWDGGIIRFDPSPGVNAVDPGKTPCAWLLGKERKLDIQVQAEIPRPQEFFKPLGPGEALPSSKPVMVGIDPLVKTLASHLSHCSSVLLTGGLGSGKTRLAHLIGHMLRNKSLFYTTYFPCRRLITDETRVSTIKETLNSLFMAASWSARLGGRSLVILDDLDKLCPTETELQVGGENGRSRQISELLCSIVRQYCGLSTGVVLLATAQGKEALNNVTVGGHVVREIISLKAPNKEGRRQVLENLVGPKDLLQPKQKGTDEHDKTGHSRQSSTEDRGGWMDGSSMPSRPGTADSHEGFVLDRDLDFLDVAGQTDGFMPGDLVLLVARARSEALIRGIGASSSNADSGRITLGRRDFERAIKGFTPASLRNVTLQSSTTTFDSIGGLHETRKILLETLQYPTTYAPIFAQCPLRLRSGLLLYGYPGCGKTLLASAVAGECGLNFISVKGPEILNKYIGASEKSVRDLFERAESARPCVLFFDEFDSIAPKRGHDSTGVTDRVVNQLLTQMDGAEGLSGVYVLAATSRPDLIDPALLRPGRLDKSLLCDLPSYDDRIDILRALSKKLKMGQEVLEGGLTKVAKRTEGYSGADLQALVYNAQLEAIHDVLGDRGDVAVNGKRGKKTSESDLSASHNSFVSFRFGEDADRAESEEQEKAGFHRSNWLAERAIITAKLEAVKIARRRRRQLRRGPVDDATVAEEAANGAVEKADQEVVIQWKHIVASLSTTRASISADERRRLSGFYRDFVVGRNGEMPSGQGPTEVGGRSSLM